MLTPCRLRTVLRQKKDLQLGYLQSRDLVQAPTRVEFPLITVNGGTEHEEF